MTTPPSTFSGNNEADRITAIVLTYNEERHIGACLSTLKWSDETVVFDSFSTDGTVNAARRAGARVVQHVFHDFAQQRNAALESAGAGWVFFVDADERCTADLALEIRQVIRSCDHPVWSTPRDNYLFGKLTRGSGWYPDYQARLFCVGRAGFDPLREVHEVAKFEGTMGYLQHTLMHYNYDNLTQFHEKQKRYAELDAGILFKQGIRPKPHNYIMQPVREFRRRFLTLRGYMDGWHGLRLCLLLAYYNFDMYRRLQRMWRKSH
jgi:(heptosyl)LPS beta-1,4-glucosyltransferase